MILDRSSTLKSRNRSLFHAGLVGAFVVVGTLACESGPKEGEEGAYYGEIAVTKPMKEAEAAMNHLEQKKDPKSLPWLHKVLESDRVLLKPKAALIVGIIGDATSVEPLVAAIDWNAGGGNDPKARAAAMTNERVAKALGKIGTAGDAKVIDTLKRLLDSTRVETQLAAIVALGKLKAVGAVDELVDIADGHTNNFMVKNAAEALGDIGDAKAVNVLIKLLFFERTGVSFYREASYALFQIGKPAVDALVDLYDGKFETGLEDMQLSAGVKKAKALVVLADIAADPRITARCTEAAGFPTSDTANALARVYGQQCLGRLADKSAGPVLRKVWDDIDQSVAEHALYSLAQVGAKEYAGDLLKMTTFDGFVAQCLSLDSRNKKEVCEAASSQVRPPRIIALSRIAPASMLPDFEKMITDEKDEKLKKTITEGRDRLLAMKDCEGKGDACFIGLLKDPNPRKRERAAYELRSARSPEAIAALVEALGDEDNEARFGAILALWVNPPKEAAARATEILKNEAGKNQYVRINEDLKRLEIKAARGY
jgi:HEAT repeat protein